MCKMKVVVNQLVLGNRELGWELWDGKGILEQTSRQIKDAINKGEKVCGLMVGKSGELELDAEGFFTTDLMIHSHIGNYRSMTNDASVTNQVLVCIGSKTIGGKRVYDCISSRFEQLKVSEEEMRAYLKIGLVTSGARLNGEEIEVASLENEKKEPEKQAEKKDRQTKDVDKLFG